MYAIVIGAHPKILEIHGLVAFPEFILIENTAVNIRGAVVRTLIVLGGASDSCIHDF